MIPGPEKATLIERLAGVFRLPYWIGCLIISFIIGTPGAYLLSYLTTGNRAQAFSNTLTLFVSGDPGYWAGIAILGLFWLLLFYAFYMARFMRMQLLSTEEELLPVIPQGEQAFHRAFKLISKLWPPIVVALIIIAFYFISAWEHVIYMFSIYATGLVNIIYLAIAYPIWFLAFCTFAWVFFGSIYGLYKLGRNPLALKSSNEDRMFGVKPFGNLSLSLSLVYFFAMAILLMILFAATMGITLAEDAFVFIILLAVLISIGIVLFFAPLYSVHKRMLEQKEKEKTELRKQAYKGVETQATSGKEDTVVEMKKKLDSLTSIMSLEVAEKNLNSVPNWPIDAPIMSRFATIIISMIAIILANLILRLLWG